MTRFSTLNPDGSEINVREIRQSDIVKCPHVIFVADHYRADGSCRCNDPTHKEMRKWGYRWRGGQWR
jgi:hypothetical protein